MGETPTIKLKVTNKAPHCDGAVTIVCTAKKEKIHRAYIRVNGLCNPKPLESQWDKKTGRFIAGGHKDRDNGVIESMLRDLEAFRDAHTFLDGTQLKRAYENRAKAVQQKTIPTFAEYIAYEVEREYKLKPTANYELYKTLLHCIQGVNLKKPKHPVKFAPAEYNGIRLADYAISEIGDEHFKAFDRWIQANKNGKGRKNLMSTFSSVINRANKEGLTQKRLGAEWRQDNIEPNGKRFFNSADELIDARRNAISTLSTDEIRRLEELDVTALADNPKAQRLWPIYKDIVLLMYYTKSRPCDVLEWRWGVHFSEKKKIAYSPRKLRNRPGFDPAKNSPIVDLNPKALEIINKYKGQSAGGYLFPLWMNEQVSDMQSIDDFHKRNIQTKHVETQINSFLKKCAKALNLNVEKLTFYTFRHSTLTHAVDAQDVPTLKIAKMAGTSVDMIEKHYYNDLTE